MTSAGRARFGIGSERDAWAASLESPSEIREAHDVGDVLPVVEWAEAEALAGRWAVLLLSYEAAPAFDDALRTREAASVLPLAWAAAYDQAADVCWLAPEAMQDPPVVDWRPAIDEARFTRDIASVIDHIRAGDTYQVNYTFPLTGRLAADPWDWFDACAREAAVPYAACIDTGDAVVVSLSPELFLERTGAHVRMRPMKGTARRGRWPDEDARLASELTVSEKARAENLMIVDLLRNDIGRVAATGSVTARDLCRLERYPTVWQLTSAVEAVLPASTSLGDLLRATFPCGSVTGAPKVSTMQIIAGLEDAARGLYTGAIALIRPGGDVVSSVAIRTAVVDRRSGVATFGVGAGITADSRAAEEWAECLAKARVVRQPAVPDDARLFETMRLADGVIVRRDRHVARMLASAALFGWDADGARVEAALDALTRRHPAGVWRARVWLDRRGGVETAADPFEADPRPWRVALATAPVDTRSPLLFNKTTRRDVYDAARAGAPAGLDDLLLWNTRRELTEATRASVVVEIDGERVTPPVACGLLPGTMREELLASGAVRERIVRMDDLPRASGLWLVNSLRGWIDVTLEA